MRLSIVLIFALLAVTVVLPGQAMAHRRSKNTIRINLDREQPTVDDFAFFMESYVHRHFYKGKFPVSEKRFYLKEFSGLKQEGNKITVKFLTLDNKTKKTFADSMDFTRIPAGNWIYITDNGEKKEVYTYVNKFGYYYQKFHLSSVFGTGLAAGLVIFGVMRLKQKKRQLPAA